MPSAVVQSQHSSARAWARALELTAPIARNPERIFPRVLEEVAVRYRKSLALIAEEGSWTYQQLSEEANRYSRWALGHSLGRGDTVCLVMTNRPGFLAVWLGLTRVGVVVALINTNLSGRSLAHAIRSVRPKHIIADEEFFDRLSALGAEIASAQIWLRGLKSAGYPSIETELASCSSGPIEPGECRTITIDDDALYIFTSGTTGLAKAARVSHARIMQWSHWFCGLLDIGPTDRMYDCLPMYHGVGGVLATCSLLTAGGSIVIRPKFSAKSFWSEVREFDCTLFQYIGELCRYLLQTPSNPNETRHKLRACCGNGLRGDVWSAFQARFAIPQILEFYSSTEGNISLFNLEGKPGAVGCIPPHLRSHSSMALIQVDSESGEPLREENGFCLRCDTNQIGEAIGRIGLRSNNVANRFYGYSNESESSKRTLQNVFANGDLWFRSGDLMRMDRDGYVSFIDRLGDSFRWKGENVSSADVSDVIRDYPGIKDAVVYGVPIPGVEGRAGMATLVSDSVIDLRGLRNHLLESLPKYAVPIFLRVRKELEVTSTFKYDLNALRLNGYNPSASNGDPLYFNDFDRGEFTLLTGFLYDRIQRGETRL